MKCCDIYPDCEQGRHCPERARVHVPIELQQLPSSRQARRRTLRDALLLATVIVVSLIGALSLIVREVAA